MTAQKTDSGLVITGQGKHRFEVDHKWARPPKGFYWPANVDTWRDLMVVPELRGRVTLLGKGNEVLARLGDDKLTVRGNP